MTREKKRVRKFHKAALFIAMERPNLIVDINSQGLVCVCNLFLLYELYHSNDHPQIAGRRTKNENLLKCIKPSICRIRCRY